MVSHAQTIQADSTGVRPNYIMFIYINKQGTHSVYKSTVNGLIQKNVDVTDLPVMVEIIDKESGKLKVIFIMCITL